MARCSSIESATAMLARPSISSPFAAAPRVLKDNPFDIISDKAINVPPGAVEEEQQVVVVGSGYDSEEEDEGFHGVDSDYERELNENDPSLYKITWSPTAEPLSSPSMKIDQGSQSPPVQKEPPVDTAVTKPKAATTSAALSFQKPPESLSLRTQVSITSGTRLKELEALQEDGSLLSLTTLCQNNPGPLQRIANALVYWEIAGPKAAKLPGLVDVQGVPEPQVKQAFMSLFQLQSASPQNYPFIYLRLRDFTVVFKTMPSKKEGYRRVAVISQSHLGLRKILRNMGVDFSLPLAPQVHSWSEIPGVMGEGQDSKYHLQAATFDKTWRSAVLVIGADNVQGLFTHLHQSTSLESALLCCSNAFLNGTMRRAHLRFADIVTYGDTKDRAYRMYRLDISGMVFPSSWNILLRSLAEVVAGEGEFTVSSKELSETAHFNMIVSKQGSAVAGKKTLTYSAASGRFTYA
ncbi:hypothetical protein GGF46_002033 [Coemansia sp. RSA 552]|nr:hypothetical protein GGF46_002033 [Coemansia sp. RSA 552]